MSQCLHLCETISRQLKEIAGCFLFPISGASSKVTSQGKLKGIGHVSDDVTQW